MTSTLTTFDIQFQIDIGLDKNYMKVWKLILIYILYIIVVSRIKENINKCVHIIINSSKKDTMESIGTFRINISKTKNKNIQSFNMYNNVILCYYFMSM